MSSLPSSNIIHLSPSKFFIRMFVLAILIWILGNFYVPPRWLIAVEVFVTVISLFFFGSIRYRLDKNILTYGAAMVIFSTFWHVWWPDSFLRQSLASNQYRYILDFLKKNLFSLHGLDQLIHADTMLFILGLTLFVSVIAQTRLLETACFKVLKKTKGSVIYTVIILSAIVSAASGILDGVSMIGLMIRILVILLFLAKVKDDTVIYVVMLATVITTVCGMWLAYGEPPNLIMKANLHPYLDDAFFLSYCLPIALGSFFLVMWNVSKKLRGRRIEIGQLDILDVYTADVRFLQSMRHGKVLIPIEFIDDYKDKLGSLFEQVNHRLHLGEPLGATLIKENVSKNLRIEMLGHYVSEDMAETLDDHYQHVANSHAEGIDQSAQTIKTILETLGKRRVQSQVVGAISFVPFIGFLIWHAMNHHIPLFWASFAGFAVALLGIITIPKMRKLALKEAKHEYSEYLFLLPLFFSITLLQKTGFFDQFAKLLQEGIHNIGISHISWLQFLGTTFLSAILDNNVVADFISRALHGLDLGILHLFSMAQIAGYAVGGCWTHIGSAQSVVAYSFIRKEVNEHFTPFQWIKAMTPLILEIFILMTLIIYGRALFLNGG
ncbi:MAG: hypothetical protein A2034_00605 [Elusimicrobia bacterium GWA2_38_7]|nr:MAG: hypothetical protein A2034_00605 [Elusimicrobia bacterium GWA2_38_7]